MPGALVAGLTQRGRDNGGGRSTVHRPSSGTGIWTLSGTNRHTGLMSVKQGTLTLANARSLGDKAEIDIADGATLELNFPDEMRVGKLRFAGRPQPPGTYHAANAPKFITGNGVLKL